MHCVGNLRDLGCIVIALVSLCPFNSITVLKDGDWSVDILCCGRHGVHVGNMPE